MKILIVMSCLLALSQAGYYPSSFYQIPAAIGHDGHPIETPEVQVAKAAHFAAHAQARYGGYGPIVPVAHYGVANALPLDTPVVAAAKLQHYHDYAVAAQKNGVVVAGPLIASGHPIDTPEVQAAKAAHFAAHAEALSRSAHGAHYRKRRAVYAGPYHIPVLDHNGVPVETPEVQAAKAHHYSEYARVAARPGQNIPDPLEHTYQHDGSAAYSGPVAYSGPAAYSAPAAYSSPYADAYIYKGPGGPPAQIGHDGQPLETHEVQAAKAAHFAAHAAVRSGQYGHLGHY